MPTGHQRGESFEMPSRSPKPASGLRTQAESIYCIRVGYLLQMFLSVFFQLIILTINLKHISLGSRYVSLYSFQLAKKNHTMLNALINP